MLTVVTFLWGGWCAPYGADYANRLYRACTTHVGCAHGFVCFTDDGAGLDSGIEVRDLPTDLPGMLPKLWMYAPDCGLEGRILSLDLDVIVTGALDDVAAYRGRFAVLEDLYEPGRCGGGLVAFEAGTMTHLWERMARTPKLMAKGCRGFERFYYRQHVGAADFWQAMLPGQMTSYRPDPQAAPIAEVPDGTRIVFFHGRGKPHLKEMPLHALWLNQ